MNLRHPTKYASRDDFPRPPSPAVYKKIAYTFLAITLIVVVGALWISSVRARVTVTVKRDTTSVQSTVEISKSPEQGQLQGRVVEGSFEKIQEFDVKATSNDAIDTQVQGTVKIVNTYSKPQTLIKTTRLSTPDGRIYRIDRTITVNPKESVTVNAISDGKGKQFTLPPGMKLTIPGLWIDLQKWIYAETTSGFTGGASSAKVVSSLDVSDAQRVLQDAVFEQAKKTLRAEAGVPEDWDAVYIQKLTDKKTNISPGQTSDQFLASVKLDVTGIFYASKEMISLVRQKLSDRLPEGRELVDFDARLVTFKADMADPSLEKARLSFSADATSRLTENSPGLSKDSIAGLPKDQAKEKLLATDGVQDVQVVIQPTWIGKIPTMKDHIDLIIK